MKSKLKIGLFRIGLDNYWSQFGGLKERIESFLKTVEQNVATIHDGIINLGLMQQPWSSAPLCCWCRSH